MYRLFSLLVFCIVLVNGLPRTPKIYNVLISTKKNLSPSHAVPVYEPVLRAAPLGFPFSPLFYQNYQPTLFQPNVVPAVQATDQANNKPADDGNQPLPLEQFIPYGFNPQNYYTPKQPEMTIQKEEPEDPKTIVANLKKNPDIPDVPPPKLPVRITA